MRTIRLLAVIALGALGTAGSCDDNLGDNEARPVTFRVSLGPGNISANGGSQDARSSTDGRFVVFSSLASNIAPLPTQFREIFLRDRFTDTVENISRLAAAIAPNSPADCLNPSISPNGRYVTFESRGNPEFNSGVQAATNLWRFDRQTKSLDPVVDYFALAWPNADCTSGTVADDGNVAFISSASNIGFVTGGNVHVFYRDMGIIPGLVLVSHAFGAPATPANGSAFAARICGNGSLIVFTDFATNMTSPATNGFYQVFIAAPGGAIELVSRADGAGAEGGHNSLYAAVSPDGQWVAFASRALNLVTGVTVAAIYVRDRGAIPATTAMVTTDVFFLVGSLSVTDTVGMSDDGRYVCFTAKDFTVKVQDRQGGVRPVSVNEAGVVLPNPRVLNRPEVSGDGRWAFWHSDAGDLVLDDDNGTTDVFGHGPLK